MVEVVKLLQFGSPSVQKTYKNLCAIIDLDFEKFQDKLIEDTGLSYDQLKEYWVFGEEKILKDEEFNNLDEIELDKYLTIHFDLDTKEILGFTAENYTCLTDGYVYFDENKSPVHPASFLYRRNL